jgi:hypothetical protein
MATVDILGGVKPIAKTEAMTNEVGIDANGKLYSSPSPTISDASPTLKGIAKLYFATGSNTDGSVTQKIITEELNKKQDSEEGKGLSANNFTTEEKNKLNGISDNANNYELPMATVDILGGVKPIAKTEAMTNEVGIDANGKLYSSPSAIKKYSVRFSGDSSNGVREDDAIGMTAEVAVDDAIVTNDFDNVSFFDRPICCCTWDAIARKWIVNAYKGEPGFSWDGTNGEVLYENKPFYYKATFDGSGAPSYVSVTGTPCEGYTLSPKFQNGNDKIYAPVFNLSATDGIAHSWADKYIDDGSLNSKMVYARAFDSKAHLERIEDIFSDCLLIWVEFAYKSGQMKMTGACNLSYNSETTVIYSVVSDTVFKVLTSVANSFKEGQTISIGSIKNGSDRTPRMKIISIALDEDETYSVITLESSVANLAAGDFLSSRMYKTGMAACYVTNASSGSHISNTNGYYPCIWRGKENPWANGYSLLCNILTKRYGSGTAEDPYTYKLWYLSDPTKYSNGAITSDYIEGNFELSQSDGYVKTLSQDSRYPFLFCTSEIGGSSSTYVRSYYYYPRYDICACPVGGRFGSSWLCFLYFRLYYLPSSADVTLAARPFCLS